MRTVLATLLSLTFCASASARYLHMADGRIAAMRYVHSEARELQASGASVDACWREGPRVIQCFYTLQDVCDVNREGSLCEITFTFRPDGGLEVWIRPARGVVTIVLRRGQLHIAE